MQVRTQCHRSKVATTFLAQNKVKLLEYRENNPDFKPIKNLWTELKDKVSDRQPPSAPELARVIKEAWVRETSKK